MVDFIYIAVFVFIAIIIISRILRDLPVNNSSPKQVDDLPVEDEATTKAKNREIIEKKKAKGDAYEEQIGNLFIDRGYQVCFHGKFYGKNDGGIDLIAYNDDEVILIQCKNWGLNYNFRISIQQIENFIESCNSFLDDISIYSRPKVRRLYVVNRGIFFKDAYYYILENPELIEHEIIPYDPKKE